MKTPNTKYKWDTMIEIIQRSYRIQTHLDFYEWHQDYVAKTFPHEALIAVWGDFDDGTLHYDICSKDKNIRTQHIFEQRGNFDHFVRYLYKNWVNNGKRWYKLDDFTAKIDEADLPHFFSKKMPQALSMLVYGVNDIRGNNDCIYIFLSDKKDFHAPDLALGMIMPHLDAALSRIESFQFEIEEKTGNYVSQGLTEREHEILHWVKMGKTNTEISMILSISLNTVKNHLKHIFTKLDVSSRAHAVANYIPPKINATQQ